MPSIVTISPRPIYLEDLAVSTSNAPATVSEEVMGVGTVPLTPISAVLYSAFTSYANDAAAAAGGVLVGQLYYNSTHSALHVRMS